MRNCLRHCLHIDWHYAVGPDENNTQPSMVWSHLVEKELSPWICWKGVAMQSMKVERLKHKQNKSIIGPTAWNHTLAKPVLKDSILCQLLYNLLLKLFSPLLFPSLCLCEVQLNTSLWPTRSFYTGLLLMKEIRVTEWKRKSAWRIQSFHLLSISYSNVAIMLYKETAHLFILWGICKKDDTARGLVGVIKILWISPSITAYNCA